MLAISAQRIPVSGTLVAGLQVVNEVNGLVFRDPIELNKQLQRLLGDFPKEVADLDHLAAVSQHPLNFLQREKGGSEEYFYC